MIDLHEVKHTRVLRGALSLNLTDHRLLRTKLSLAVQKKTRHLAKPPLKKLNIRGLKDAGIAEDLCAHITIKLEEDHATSPPTDDLEVLWSRLRNTTYEASLSVLGTLKRKHQDWFDDNDQQIQHLLKEMHLKHKAWLSDKTSNLN